jgi:hypothetical protein
VLSILAILGGAVALLLIGFIIGHEVGWEASKYDTQQRMDQWRRQVGQR